MATVACRLWQEDDYCLDDFQNLDLEDFHNPGLEDVQNLSSDTLSTNSSDRATHKSGDPRDLSDCEDDEKGSQDVVLASPISHTRWTTWERYDLEQSMASPEQKRADTVDSPPMLVYDYTETVIHARTSAAQPNIYEVTFELGSKIDPNTGMMEIVATRWYRLEYQGPKMLFTKNGQEVWTTSDRDTFAVYYFLAKKGDYIQPVPQNDGDPSFPLVKYIRLDSVGRPVVEVTTEALQLK